MNESIISGAWKDVKGRLLETWGQITDDEVEKTKGNLTSIMGLLQQKVGYTQDEAKDKMQDFMKRFNFRAQEAKNVAAEKMEQGHKKVNEVLDKVQNKLEEPRDPV